MSTSAELFALSEHYYLPVYRPRRIVLDHGKGSRIWDRDGREYVDFGAGIAVNALGHAHPALLAALTEQAGKLWHTSNVFVSEPPLRLAEELVTASRFAQRVFFCNSGAEANEAAIKLVRKCATAQGRTPEQRVILSFRGSFHGRTLAAVTATAQPKYHEGYEPLPPGFRYSDFNDLAAAEAAMAAGDVCAVLVEPVQGEGGVTPATPEFLQGLRALCDRHGALLVLDEIQCGMGRTGQLFACTRLWRDARCRDAGEGARQRLSDRRDAGRRQGGARRCSSVRMAPPSAVTRWRRRWPARRCGSCPRPRCSPTSRRQSQAIRDGLAAIDAELALFSEIRGRGLMLGAQLREAHAGKAGEILDRCVEHGLLPLQAGPDVLRFVPALNIGEQDVAEGLSRLRAAIAGVRRSTSTKKPGRKPGFVLDGGFRRRR